MWKKIRGAGLAYGYYMRTNTNEGMLTFGLFKSSHPVNAFKAAKDIIVRFTSEIIISGQALFHVFIFGHPMYFSWMGFRASPVGAVWSWNRPRAPSSSRWSSKRRLSRTQ